jgi:hypothetical protein
VLIDHLLGKLAHVLVLRVLDGVLAELDLGDLAGKGLDEILLIGPRLPIRVALVNGLLLIGAA